MKYIELCAGVGGTRAGLDSAGWECVFAVDIDPDAIAVHEVAFGRAEQLDVTTLEPSALPDFEVLVAGFPCQPFSSSGTRKGFQHRSGHVFESLMSIVDDRTPPVLLFENVVGLLSNKSGHTFASILGHLTARGYSVEWLVIDACWLGVPQSRPRVLIAASRADVLPRTSPARFEESTPGGPARQYSIFGPLLDRFGLEATASGHGGLTETTARLAPAIGKRRPSKGGGFGGYGWAVGDQYRAYRTRRSAEQRFGLELAEIVAPEFSAPELIRSVRFWSERGGGGKHGIHVRNLPISHCVGTSLGGAPLFSVPLAAVREPAEREAFLQYADWRREQQELLVMRLRPDRAVQLFGPHSSAIQKAIEGWKAGATRKFKLVGNMVAPEVARIAAEAIQNALAVNGGGDSSETA